MTSDAKIEYALALIATVPGYEQTARDLRRTSIRYVSDLPDRGQATLRGHILIGPEALGSGNDADRVSLAGTLVHEHYHTRQHPLLKTASFWRGVASSTHPMHRYERPAYARQAEFLLALAAAEPDLKDAALRERQSALAAFQSLYGD